MIPNKYNKIFAEKMLTMTVRELECEVRACEYQIIGYIKKRTDYSWSTDANDQYYHTIKTRKALAKCMPIWAERLLLIENYMPMAKLMES